MRRQKSKESVKNIEKYLSDSSAKNKEQSIEQEGQGKKTIMIQDKNDEDQLSLILEQKTIENNPGTNEQPSFIKTSILHKGSLVNEDQEQLFNIKNF